MSRHDTPSLQACFFCCVLCVGRSKFPQLTRSRGQIRRCLLVWHALLSLRTPTSSTDYHNSNPQMVQVGVGDCLFDGGQCANSLVKSERQE